MAIERRRVFFEGQVQGVGFRMTTRRLAQGLPLVGFVRNLDDGRVELLIEGEPTALSRLLAAIHREFGESIRTWDQVIEPVGAPRLVGFSIR